MAARKSFPRVMGRARLSRPGARVEGGVPAGPDATGGLAVEDDNGVAITASTTETLNNITAAVGGGTVGIGLNVLVNIVKDTTHAMIDQATVHANGTGSWVIVRARGHRRLGFWRRRSVWVPPWESAPESISTSSRTTPKQCWGACHRQSRPMSLVKAAWRSAP